MSWQKNVMAQLSAADSAYFNNVFLNPLYINDSVYPGTWYQYEPVTSFYNHYLIMDTNFIFKTSDLDSISNLSIDDSLHQYAQINSEFNAYPSFISQNDPVVSLPFHLNNKQGISYSFLYPDTNQNHCKNAFLIVPGTGTNASYDIIRGLGYHNQLCYVTNTCRSYGDVYTFVKPNEEFRAIYWDKRKLNEYVVDYLITQNTFYGTNYLIEMIAMIKYLKANYDKVFLMGLSEGGYSALLCTMYSKPDAAVISGGYSINFDTCTTETGILYTRFDSLVYQYDKVKVKDKISQSPTHYLFTWGDGDPVLTMDPEHDFHYTENYFGGVGHCSWFYDFNDHTFPPCNTIDTFINRILSIPEAHFFITDSSSNGDSLYTRVRFCKSASYTFDMYRDTTFIQTYTAVSDSIDITLTDSGFYYLKNIMDTNNIHGRCNDTVFKNKQPIPLFLSSSISPLGILLQNPITDNLVITWNQTSIPFAKLIIYNSTGQMVYQTHQYQSGIPISTQNWPKGIYLVRIFQDDKSLSYRILKQ
ncbi:MAG: T9SS type A sorting domain-containing protein [Bacteroidetes bacterium]|nr:T9SS type A sorting domain-containing protein [Bacteroidota bacterium]